MSHELGPHFSRKRLGFVACERIKIAGKLEAIELQTIWEKKE
jgi:hypothetical protein